MPRTLDPTDHLARLMDLALSEARKAHSPEKERHEADVPVGAVIHAPNGNVIAQASNAVVASHDPTAHAEILVIRKACAIRKTHRLDGLCLTVTLEPCTLCAAAIALARIRCVYYGASNPKGGGIEHGVRWFSHPACLHRVESVGGIQEMACRTFLKDFFALRRHSQHPEPHREARNSLATSTHTIAVRPQTR